jgi:hypothetical protein
VPGLEVIRARRVVATPASLDGAVWPEGSLALRIAPDDVLMIGDGPLEVNDLHAIVDEESGFAGIWMPAGEAEEFLAGECAWELPEQRPAVAQGMVAGLPAKLWLDHDRVLLMVPAALVHELAARLQ